MEDHRWSQETVEMNPSRKKEERKTPPNMGAHCRRNDDQQAPSTGKIGNISELITDEQPEKNI